MQRSAFVRRASRRPFRRRGAAVVEFAFVAPLFFLMVLGMIEFGRAMMVQALLTNAAQLGARSGSLDGALATDVTKTVNSYLAAGGISGATTTCTPNPPSSALPGEDVTAKVTIPYTSVSWLPAPRFLSKTTLSATSIVQRESGK